MDITFITILLSLAVLMVIALLAVASILDDIDNDL